MVGSSLTILEFWDHFHLWWVQCSINLPIVSSSCRAPSSTSRISVTSCPPRSPFKLFTFPSSFTVEFNFQPEFRQSSEPNVGLGLHSQSRRNPFSRTSFPVFLGGFWWLKPSLCCSSWSCYRFETSRGIRIISPLEKQTEREEKREFIAD